MQIEIKCTDKRHPARRTHWNARVRALWFDGVLATTNRQRPAGYSEICPGCALANELDDVPEFRGEKSIEQQIEDLKARVAALEP